jgi:hypothetical protein
MILNNKTNFNCAGVLGTLYPNSPIYNPDCVVNQKQDTISNNWPKMVTVMGPRNVKHIYENVPDTAMGTEASAGPFKDRGRMLYPQQWFMRSIGTMYDVDLSSFGPYNKRETYGFKAYPYHHYSPRETREYGRLLPILDLRDLTQYTTLKDGYYGR